MRVAQCKFCHQEFEYEPAMSRGCRGGARQSAREICDECRAGRQHWLKRVGKAKDRAERLNRVAPRATAYGDFGLTTEATAARLRISTRQVERAEASALAKLRNSPDLREAYDRYKEEGLPLVEYIRAVLRELLLRPRQAAMLDYQLELLEWSRILDAAERAGVQRKELERTRAAANRCRQLLLEGIGLEGPSRSCH
jgi:hypothetical protein